jgi:uncharacterized cupin superfamily protein
MIDPRVPVATAVSARIGGMTDSNVFSNEFEYDDGDPPGYRAGMINVGRIAGGRENNVKLFSVPAGVSLCPYHYEYVEEWLVVLEGSVTLRTPEGNRELSPGALVSFPAGPEGAHKVTAGSAPARLLMFSNAHEPSVAVYPDSDKIGVWSGGGPEDNVMLRRAEGHLGYYDGEV